MPHSVPRRRRQREDDDLGGVSSSDESNLASAISAGPSSLRRILRSQHARANKTQSPLIVRHECRASADFSPSKRSVASIASIASSVTGLPTPPHSHNNEIMAPAAQRSATPDEPLQAFSPTPATPSRSAKRRRGSPSLQRDVLLSSAKRRAMEIGEVNSLLAAKTRQAQDSPLRQRAYPTITQVGAIVSRPTLVQSDDEDDDDEAYTRDRCILLPTKRSRDMSRSRALQDATTSFLNRPILETSLPAPPLYEQKDSYQQSQIEAQPATLPHSSEDDALDFNDEAEPLPDEVFNGQWAKPVINGSNSVQLTSRRPESPIPTPLNASDAVDESWSPTGSIHRRQSTVPHPMESTPFFLGKRKAGQRKSTPHPGLEGTVRALLASLSSPVKAQRLYNERGELIEVRQPSPLLHSPTPSSRRNLHRSLLIKGREEPIEAVQSSPRHHSPMPNSRQSLRRSTFSPFKAVDVDMQQPEEDLLTVLAQEQSDGSGESAEDLSHFTFDEQARISQGPITKARRTGDLSRFRESMAKALASEENEEIIADDFVYETVLRDAAEESEDILADDFVYETVLPQTDDASVELVDEDEGQNEHSVVSEASEEEAQASKEEASIDLEPVVEDEEESEEESIDSDVEGDSHQASEEGASLDDGDAESNEPDRDEASDEEESVQSDVESKMTRTSVGEDASSRHYGNDIETDNISEADKMENALVTSTRSPSPEVMGSRYNPDGDMGIDETEAQRRSDAQGLYEEGLSYAGSSNEESARSSPDSHREEHLAERERRSTYSRSPRSENPDRIALPQSGQISRRQGWRESMTADQDGSATISRIMLERSERLKTRPSMVEISSFDTEAAIRAAAILKANHRYVQYGMLHASLDEDESEWTEYRLNDPNISSGERAARLSLDPVDHSAAERMVDYRLAQKEKEIRKVGTPIFSGSHVTASPITPLLPGSFPPLRLEKSTASSTSRKGVGYVPKADAFGNQDFYALEQAVQAELCTLYQQERHDVSLDKIQRWERAIRKLDRDKLAVAFLHACGISLSSDTSQWSQNKIRGRITALLCKKVKRLQERYPDIDTTTLALDTTMGQASTSKAVVDESGVAETSALVPFRLVTASTPGPLPSANTPAMAEESFGSPSTRVGSGRTSNIYPALPSPPLSGRRAARPTPIADEEEFTTGPEKDTAEATRDLSVGLTTLVSKSLGFVYTTLGWGSRATRAAPGLPPTSDRKVESQAGAERRPPPLSHISRSQIIRTSLPSSTSIHCLSRVDHSQSQIHYQTGSSRLIRSGTSSIVNPTALAFLSPNTHAVAKGKHQQFKQSREARRWTSPMASAASRRTESSNTSGFTNTSSGLLSTARR